MRKFLLSTLGLVSMAAPAFAADLPVKAPPVYVPPPMYNWSGFYIGADGGWGRSNNCWDFFAAGGGMLPAGCFDKSGGIVGGQIGYRWQQPNNHFVFGVEAQGDWANLNRTQISVSDPALTFGNKLDALGLFTAQIGWAIDNWLWYVKGGAAVTNNTFTVSSTIGGLGIASAGSTRWGGSVGTGFEYGFSPGWSVGVEYDRLMMDAQNFVVPVAAPLVGGSLARVTQGVDIATVRVNYRFNWGGGGGGSLFPNY
jgi:outer membrane immunogenic protein